MNQIERYRAHLQQMCEWEPFLLAESRLPGPRANLELARAAAEEGDPDQFYRWLSFGPAAAPVNSAAEFLPFCGTLGLGKVLADGDRQVLADLRALAEDPRWRVREAVAMALQKWGAADMPALLAEMSLWATGSRFVQRAAASATCEPSLLKDSEAAVGVLSLIDAITTTIVGASDRRGAGFIALRKALGYCWSVAIEAAPEYGMILFDRWAQVDDPDIHWIIRENLSKARLKKLGASKLP